MTDLRIVLANLGADRALLVTGQHHRAELDLTTLDYVLNRLKRVDLPPSRTANVGATAEAVVIADLERMVERLDELEDYGAAEGYRALETKAQEARGPLASALDAMRQYGDGTLRRQD